MHPNILELVHADLSISHMTTLFPLITTTLADVCQLAAEGRAPHLQQKQVSLELFYFSKYFCPTDVPVIILGRKCHSFVNCLKDSPIVIPRK